MISIKQHLQQLKEAERVLTENEIRIIERDAQQQEAISSELNGRSGYVGTMASLGLFIVVQWQHADSFPKATLILLAILGWAFVIFIIVSWGRRHPIPAPPKAWLETSESERSELERAGFNRQEAAKLSDTDLIQIYWLRLSERSDEIRKLNQERGKLLRLGGILAVVPVLAVIGIEISIRYGAVFK